MRAGDARPPRWAASLLAALLPGPTGAEVRGELAEEHRRLAGRRGRIAAGLWYAGQLLLPGTWVLARELRRSGSAPGPRLGWSVLDLKLAGRMLRKQPMLTFVAVLALGLGIPASLSVTHLWHAQWAPLPYDEGERIVGLRNWDVARSRAAAGDFDDFVRWRDDLASFEAIGAARAVEWNVYTDDGRAEPVRGAELTASAFDILRVPPLLGRTLVTADEIAGAADVVVISHDLWSSRFGRDPEIVGRELRISGVPHTVVGVMPEGFLFPRSHRLWLPLRSRTASVPGSEGFSWTFGRLADGVSMEQASAEVATLGRRIADVYDLTLVTADERLIRGKGYRVLANR